MGKYGALDVIRAMLREDLPRLAGVDPELSDLVAALTARFPSRRPQTAVEALRWFQPIRNRLEAT